jgi:hypothetical protein
MPAPIEPPRTCARPADGVHHGEGVVEHVTGGVGRRHAAEEGLPRVRALLIASDGAAAALDYGLHPGWQEVLHFVEADGVAAFLMAV